MRCTKSAVSLDNVLNIHGFDLARALKTSPALLDTSGPATKHDGTVTSVSLDQGAPRHLRLVQKGDLDMELAQDFIDHLLETAGEDIFRMKGVLAVANAQRKFVYHAVHMTYHGSFEEPWGPDEPRESKMVFIGKDLDERALADSFNDCLATAENMEVKMEALRFTLDDEVECRTGLDEWSAGKVVGLLYRDDDEMRPGVVAPYHVQLEDEGGRGHAETRCVWVPSDADDLIRARQRRSKRLRGSGHGTDDHAYNGSHELEHSHEHDSVCHSTRRHKHGRSQY